MTTTYRRNSRTTIKSRNTLVVLSFIVISFLMSCTKDREQEALSDILNEIHDNFGDVSQLISDEREKVEAQDFVNTLNEMKVGSLSNEDSIREFVDILNKELIDFDSVESTTVKDYSRFIQHIVIYTDENKGNLSTSEVIDLSYAVDLLLSKAIIFHKHGLVDTTTLVDVYVEYLVAIHHIGFHDDAGLCHMLQDILQEAVKYDQSNKLANLIAGRRLEMRMEEFECEDH